MSVPEPLLSTGAYVIPLASISERDQRGRKGGSGYGRVGFVEAGNVRARRRARKCVFLPVEVIPCIEEKISIERRELEVVGM